MPSPLPNQARQKRAKKSRKLTALLVAAFIGAIGYLIGYGNFFDDEGKPPIVAAGKYHSFIIDGDGVVYATGNNEFGQLGTGDKDNRDVFTEVESLSAIVAVAAGDAHSLALDSGGHVYAAGRNGYGQLGLGDETNRETFALVDSLRDKNITAIAAGDDDSFAIDSDGNVYAAGYNGYGQLGTGDKDNRYAFALVSSLSDKNVTAIASGYAHVVALNKVGAIYAAGRNGFGQLGLGDKADRRSFTLVDSLEGKKIVAIASGDAHSLALDSDGKVYATGSNNKSQLGLGDIDDRKTFALVSSLNDANITEIAAGAFHSFALDTGGKIYAAGANDFGQLGFGDSGYYAARKTFAFVYLLKDKKIARVAAGDHHSLALDSDNKIYAAGANNYGRLGLGDNDNRKTFTPVVLPAKD
ncbi:MAG: hypothetical protein LBO72_08335 [Helicobacteraceae bacterium]|jgi:alpha-tubulin suppressor-like RCC1 family protein|nr:hypothetical protein [Helicobacteraceae bacterium]